MNGVAPAARRRPLLPLLVLLGGAAACDKRDVPPATTEVAPVADAARDVDSSSAMLAKGGLASSLGDASVAALLVVPFVARHLEPTGNFDVKVWGNAPNTKTFLDASGKGAVPVSEARFLWGTGQLYLFFYAGDLDLEAHASKHDGPVWADDSVAVSFFTGEATKRVVQISVMGVVADGTCPVDAIDLGDARCDLSWESGARAGTDRDGTVNKVGDNDEEWAVEAAIPLRAPLPAAAAGATLHVGVHRCEVGRDGRHACGSWGGPSGGELRLSASEPAPVAAPRP